MSGPRIRGPLAFSSERLESNQSVPFCALLRSSIFIR